MILHSMRRHLHLRTMYCCFSLNQSVRENQQKMDKIENKQIKKNRKRLKIGKIEKKIDNKKKLKIKKN